MLEPLWGWSTRDLSSPEFSWTELSSWTVKWGRGCRILHLKALYKWIWDRGAGKWLCALGLSKLLLHRRLVNKVSAGTAFWLPSPWAPLMALVSHSWGLPPAPPLGQVDHLSSVLGAHSSYESCWRITALQLSCSHAHFRLWMLLILTHGLISWLGLGPVLSPWTSLVIPGLCLTWLPWFHRDSDLCSLPYHWKVSSWMTLAVTLGLPCSSRSGMVGLDLY